MTVAVGDRVDEGEATTPSSLDGTLFSKKKRQNRTIKKPKTKRWSQKSGGKKCHSIRSGASGLPYYCTPLVCISAVIGLLAVW